MKEKSLKEFDLLVPPKSFPSSSCIRLSAHEARGLVKETVKELGVGISFLERQLIALNDSDAIGFKTSREMEGVYCDYIERQFGKKVILAGPVVPEPPNSALEEKWANFLGNFGCKKVIFCAFGSECVLENDQFQELILGLELTGLPFLVALKPPKGYEKIECALPEGFEERVKERGLVHGGWVQQQLILRHSSVGCFVTHCGSGSLLEGLMNECQLVLVPNVGDQIVNARMMSGDLRVGVEVKRGNESGAFTREGVCKAVKDAMDDESEVGKEMRRNHDKWREFLLSKGLEDSYIDGFVEKLLAMISSS